MKNFIFIIFFFVFVAKLSAQEPSKYAIGMLLFMDGHLGRADKVNMSDFSGFMENEYNNYTIKLKNPRNLDGFTLGFRFYSIQNDKWEGIIVTHNECGIYKLKGFDHNDFTSFFSDFKYIYHLGGMRKVSNRKILKNLEKLGVDIDFKCLYKASKNFECTLKEKYPCANRSWDWCIIGGNCFK